MFGSVTTADISEALAAKGFTIDKKKVALAEPIKVLGEYDVPLKLHREVSATVKLAVKKEQ
jgi:large subunit ribosomal protein L9